MQRTLALVPALLALVLSLFAVLRQRAASASDRDSEARLGQLAGELEGLRARPSSPAPDEGLEARLAELVARLERLERAPERRPLAEPASPVAAAAPAPEPPPRPAVDAAERREFEDLLTRLIGPDYDLHGSPEELERFFELARGTDFLEEHLRALEERVSADPGDLEARMALADGYVAKLLTMPHGPEQGVWGNKAEEQWRQVSERDPEHWAAHFALGNNFSFYPDVMGRTGDAIRYLERAREIQERLTPVEEHVRTYLSLARMYLRDGRREEARATIEAGLRLHPGHAELLAERDRLGD